MPWLRRASDGTATLTIHAQPGAKRTEIVGLHGDALKIRLAAPPVDGKANARLIAFLADYLAVPKAGVSVLAGESGRHKVVWIQGVSEAALCRLEAAVAAEG